MSKESDNLNRCSRIFVSWRKFSITILSIISVMIGGVYLYASTITVFRQKIKNQAKDIFEIQEEHKTLKNMQKLNEQTHNLIEKIADKLEIGKK